MRELMALETLSDEHRATQMADHHKAPRAYLGVANHQINTLVAEWRATRDVQERVALASALWDSDIHEARIAAAKLLVQARIRPDDDVWRLIASWVPQFDGKAIADQAMIAGQKRLVADPMRLDELQGWLDHPNMWTRRAALVGTLPWAKMNNPKTADLARRDRLLDWAGSLADDSEQAVQKAVAWWLRDLSKRDPARVRAFLCQHGAGMEQAVRREAGRLAQDL